MDLFLLENTSITLTELDNMNPWRKLRYFEFLKNKFEKQAKEMNKGNKKTLKGSSL